MNHWTWDVYGLPAPQGSKTAYVRNGRASLVESSKELPAWRDSVIYSVRTGKRPKTPLAEPVHVGLEFRFPRPKSHYGKDGGIKPAAASLHTVKPDLDKLIRGVLDALVIAQVLTDDATVSSIFAEKRYVYPSELPGCTILVSLPDRIEGD